MGSRSVPLVARSLLILGGMAFLACSCVDGKVTRPPTVVPPPLGIVAVTPTTSPQELSPTVPVICPTPTITWPCYSLLDACSEEECLLWAPDVPNYPIGLATLQGFYTQIEKKDFDNEAYRCDAFVVLAGSMDLIRAYLGLVEEGNAIYSKDDQGHLVLPLSLASLSEDDRSKILSSTEQSPVVLLVLAQPAGFTEAPVCYSHVKVLKVR